MRGIFSLCFPALILLGSAATAATTLPETKLTAGDGMINEWFGWSVGISGTTAIVGAVGNRVNGDRSGAAYLFDAATGMQIARLTTGDGPNDGFVESVAISDDTAIVSAFSRDGVTGSVSLIDAATGEKTGQLTAGDHAANDVFGNSVAISGTTAIVGAYADDSHDTNSGAAYLFDTATGEQIAKLTASDSAAGDVLGFSVGISGSTAIVGTYAQGGFTGAAYLFDTATGEQIAKLVASNAERYDQFGISVAISGSTAIVGAYGQGGYTGAAYLFDTTTGMQIAKLTASDGAAGDYFGRSVAISGNLAIVGAPYSLANGVYSGAVYIFDITTLEQIAMLTPSDGEHFDAFGASVAISGTTAIVGAYAKWAHDQGEFTGAAYLYDLSSLNPPAPAPVPLPAGIWLLGSALGLGAFAARRRDA